MSGKWEVMEGTEGRVGNWHSDCEGPMKGCGLILLTFNACFSNCSVCTHPGAFQVLGYTECNFPDYQLAIKICGGRGKASFLYKSKCVYVAESEILCLAQLFRALL